MSRFLRAFPVLALLVPSLACDEDPGPPPIELAVDANCEWLSDAHCMLPWPSDRWLQEAATETGVQLDYTIRAVPQNKDFAPFDPEPYRIFDGYSASSVLLTSFDSAVDLDGLAANEDYAPSLEPGHPTVILDLDRGTRVAHIVEFDRRADEDWEGTELPPTLMYLMPSARLEPGTRYGVAILDSLKLVDGSSPRLEQGFQVLRDGQITTNPAVEVRRPGYDSMFEAFEAAGIDRGSLVQGWHFTTASNASFRGDLLAMRDDAFSRLDAEGASCTVESVEPEPNAELAYRLRGTYQVPLYMDSPRPPTRAVRGADGRPEFQGWTDIPFTLNVGRSLLADDAGPGRLLGYGHGLMGHRDEVNSSFARSMANDYGFVTVAADWQGMSEVDFVNVGNALADVAKFPTVGERLMQGVLNHAVLVRSFMTDCAALPELQHEGRSVIDTSQGPYYVGISQGSIMGAATVAISPDIQKAALLVGGMSYSVMIPRSSNWNTYELILRAWYHDRMDREIMLMLMSSFWDLAEGGAFMSHFRGGDDLLPNSPEKGLLYQIARYDTQVPNLASDMAARTMNLPLLGPSSVEPWGIETTTGPADSAIVYYDFGVEPTPPGNLVPEEDNHVHGSQRHLDATKQQIDRFFRPGGTIEHTCEGVCDPE